MIILLFYKWMVATPTQTNKQTHTHTHTHTHTLQLFSIQFTPLLITTLRTHWIIIHRPDIFVCIFTLSRFPYLSHSSKNGHLGCNVKLLIAQWPHGPTTKPWQLFSHVLITLPWSTPAPALTPEGKPPPKQWSIGLNGCHVTLCHAFPFINIPHYGCHLEISPRETATHLTSPLKSALCVRACWLQNGTQVSATHSTSTLYREPSTLYSVAVQYGFWFTFLQPSAPRVGTFHTLLVECIASAGKHFKWKRYREEKGAIQTHTISPNHWRE